MPDRVKNQMDLASDPAVDAEDADIASSDHAFAAVTRAIYVGTGGDVKVDMHGGTAVTFKSVAGGTVLPIAVSNVYQTGSTASDIVGLF